MLKCKFTPPALSALLAKPDTGFPAAVVWQLHTRLVYGPASCCIGLSFRLRLYERGLHSYGLQLLALLRYAWNGRLHAVGVGRHCFSLLGVLLFV